MTFDSYTWHWSTVGKWSKGRASGRGSFVLWHFKMLAKGLRGSYQKWLLVCKSPCVFSGGLGALCLTHCHPQVFCSNAQRQKLTSCAQWYPMAQSIKLQLAFYNVLNFRFGKVSQFCPFTPCSSFARMSKLMLNSSFPFPLSLSLSFLSEK